MMHIDNDPGSASKKCIFYGQLNHNGLLLLLLLLLLIGVKIMGGPSNAASQNLSLNVRNA